MYRKEIISYIISICFVLVACVLHALEFYNCIDFPVNTIVLALYTFVIFIWMHNMMNRVLRSSIVTRFRIIGPSNLLPYRENSEVRNTYRK